MTLYSVDRPHNWTGTPTATGVSISWSFELVRRVRDSGIHSFDSRLSKKGCSNRVRIQILATHIYTYICFQGREALCTGYDDNIKMMELVFTVQ